KFEYVIPYGKSKWKKVLGYLKFKSYATRIIKSNNYDHIIVLPTQTAILFYNLLVKNFKHAYIIDIRDYTYENSRLFYRIIENLIRNSGLKVITSPAYKSFLPKDRYLISHNINKIDDKNVTEYRERERLENSPIKISCIGSIRFL